MSTVAGQRDRVETAVLEHYQRHPDLIVALLERLGATDVHRSSNLVRSTCPIHRGANPNNFVVWFDKGIPIFKCYSDCNTKKTPLTELPRRVHSLTKRGAIEYLASVAGIAIDGKLVTVSRAVRQEESLQAFRQRLGIADQNQIRVFDESWVARSMRCLRNPALAPVWRYLTGPVTEETAWGERCCQLSPEVLDHFEVVVGQILVRASRVEPGS
ncbi:MAG: hypothetical protein NTW19_06060 [Planctomycetota bacterium]|nr:hypothetical protein [Planctomycetota bacterium]